MTHIDFTDWSTTALVTAATGPVDRTIAYPALESELHARAEDGDPAAIEFYGWAE